MKETDRPVSVIARELGVQRNRLYMWKDQMEKKGEITSSKRGRPKKADESESAKLRAENKRLKEENEILKKAAIFFAKEMD